jgi:hypothetical protein
LAARSVPDLNAPPASRSQELDLSLQPVGGTFLAGDFDGDGSLDAAQWIGGRWKVRTSADRSTVDWGGWSPDVQWLDLLTGDVDGDGKDDIVGRTGAGHWWVARSTGNAFRNARWGRWSNQAHWSEVTLSDVSGDGRADLVGRTDAGQWWISVSTGRELMHHRAADLLAASGALDALIVARHSVPRTK